MVVNDCMGLSAFVSLESRPFCSANSRMIFTPFSMCGFCVVVVVVVNDVMYSRFDRGLVVSGKLGCGISKSLSNVNGSSDSESIPTNSELDSLFVTSFDDG